jgi:hypothetical protein
MKFLNFFRLLWVIFAILDPDPDSEYGNGSTGLDPDPIRIRNPGLMTGELKLVAAVVQERERKLKERLLKEEEERKKKEQPESALHTLDTVVIKRRWEWDNGYLFYISVVDPDLQ